MKATIGYLQNSPVFGNVSDNLEAAVNMVSSAPADLLVLPELFATGYTFQSRQEAEALAEDIDGPTSAALLQIARKTGGAVAGGFIEKENGKIYNAALLVEPGKIIGTYRKIHLFNREKEWFSPGNRPFSVLKAGKLKIGMMICFDWVFPESARSLALLGADIIAHPANLVLPWCQQAMTTRCLENGLHAVTANRIGTESRGSDQFTFTGMSQITAPKGTILASAPENRNEIRYVATTIDHQKAAALSAGNSLFDDRRKEMYTLD